MQLCLTFNSMEMLTQTTPMVATAKQNLRSGQVSRQCQASLQGSLAPHVVHERGAAGAVRNSQMPLV